MDKNSPCKEVSEELARESLISISNSLPDKFLSSDNITENAKCNNDVAAKDSDEAEKCISELISISSCQSQDVSMSPSVPLPNHKE
uniref:Uncharacterized protein n=1 Tax=Rhizophora mucronata TaxID=61149 RepID=A0A2P2JW71_RHIMU